MAGSRPLHLHPDRLFPAEDSVRSVARRLYAQVAALPLVSPHGHVDAGLFAADTPLPDPATLLVTPDHYLTRLLHAGAGVPLEDLGVRPVDGEAAPPAPEPRQIWRTVCAHWALLRGTPTKLWLEQELHDLFGVREMPSADNADALFDRISAALVQPEFRPRALYQRFGLEVLATTDPATAELTDHAALAADPSWKGHVVPTFRPDAVTDPERPGFAAGVARLGELTCLDTASWPAFLDALRARRQHFLRHGATSTDHGFPTPNTTPLPEAEAAALHSRALAGGLTAAEAEAYRGAALFEMARMSCEDGLVMQIHPGVCRNHHTAAFHRFGPDVGGDIPVATEYTRALRPLLDAFGEHPNLTVVAFTVDETVFSRELAPMAGYYPALRVGAPWWFLDAPDAISRWRAAITESAGFANTAGFVDDTRALCSIPARHDVARRLDCGYLARLVVEHRLTEDEAAETAAELAYHLPRRVFRVGEAG